MDDLASLLNEYKICIQNWEQDIHEKHDMITALTFTVTCMHDSQHKLMRENRSVTMHNAKLLSKSKLAVTGINREKHKITITSLPETY